MTHICNETLFLSIISRNLSQKNLLLVFWYVRYAFLIALQSRHKFMVISIIHSNIPWSSGWYFWYDLNVLCRLVISSCLDCKLPQRNKINLPSKIIFIEGVTESFNIIIFLNCTFHFSKKRMTKLKYFFSLRFLFNFL